VRRTSPMAGRAGSSTCPHSFAGTRDEHGRLERDQPDRGAVVE
jgi:hypothetical protein